MHSSQYGRTTFHYNSALSGEVIIMRGSERIEIPGEHILSFVADHVAREKISQLEVKTPSEILGIGIVQDYGTEEK